MLTRTSYIAASTIVVAALSAGAVQAAPIGGNPGRVVGTQAETSAVQKVDYRRCWIVDGVRHCRWFASPYDDGYGYYDDYYDYGPGYGYGGPTFFFGGGRGHHGGHFGHGGGHFGGGHVGGGHFGRR
jgi:hypothetical protein